MSGAMKKDEQCSETLFRDYSRYSCSRRGVVMREGKSYCKQHDPVAVAARQDARRAVWAAKDAAADAVRERAARLAAANDAVLEAACRFVDVLQSKGATVCTTTEMDALEQAVIELRKARAW